MGQIQKAIQKDCCLIFEALRRLIEGTCCLQGEERVCAWDLFYKLHLAFIEHVEFEESAVLPHQTKTERERHHREHLRLCELIEKARWEFECAEGDRFREILLELSRELRAHHERDPMLEVNDGRLFYDPNLLRILEREGQAFLG